MSYNLRMAGGRTLETIMMCSGCAYLVDGKMCGNGVSVQTRNRLSRERTGCDIGGVRRDNIVVAATRKRGIVVWEWKPQKTAND
jgi:hypothetical protein